MQPPFLYNKIDFLKEIKNKIDFKDKMRHISIKRIFFVVK